MGVLISQCLGTFPVVPSEVLLASRSLRPGTLLLSIPQYTEHPTGPPSPHQVQSQDRSPGPSRRVPLLSQECAGNSVIPNSPPHEPTVCSTWDLPGTRHPFFLEWGASPTDGFGSTRSRWPHRFPAGGDWPPEAHT